MKQRDKVKRFYKQLHKYRRLSDPDINARVTYYVSEWHDLPHGEPRVQPTLRQYLTLHMPNVFSETERKFTESGKMI